MKRLTIFVLMLTALALPASAVARNFAGSHMLLRLKAHKAQLKEVGPYAIPLHCDEGAIDYASGAGASTVQTVKLDPPLSLKHRGFHLIKRKTERYAVGADSAGNPIVAQVDFVVDARGKFNKRYSKASGNLRITGSFLGPEPNSSYAGQRTLYHNCDSGVVGWGVHQTGF